MTYIKENPLGSGLYDIFDTGGSPFTLVEDPPGSGLYIMPADWVQYEAGMWGPPESTEIPCIPAISTVPGIQPFVQIGLGDTRVDVGTFRWDVSNWDEATWSGSEPTWVDVEHDVQDIVAELGRERATDRYQPSTATLVMDNSSGWADVDPDDLITLTLRPGRSIRFGIIHEDFGVRVLWRGFIDTVMPTYDPESGADTVTVECIDALGEAGRSQIEELAAPVGASERGSQRITRILDAAAWPVAARQIASTSVTMIETTLGKQTLDLLTATADSEGGAVFGDLNGRVAYRGKDWQTYPSGQANDGTIGNVGTAPALPGVDAYLIPQIGTATTIDTPDLVLPNEFTLVWKSIGPHVSDGTAFQTVASQWAGDPDNGWVYFRTQGTGEISFAYTPTGNTADFTYVSIGTQVPTGADEYLAVSITRDNGAGNSALISWRSDDAGETWIQAGTNLSAVITTVHDSSQVLRVGAFDGYQWPWYGRMYQAEMRRGLDPAGGSLMWRFDAGDWPGYGNDFVSAGRPWTTTATLAIEPAIAPTPAEVCPSQWEMSYRREDIVTKIVLGRDDGGATPQRVYNDPTGQAIYGVETPYTLTDLTTETNTDLDRLAARLFRTRGKYNAPRVEAVTINAHSVNADGAFNPAARDLLSLVSVFEPSRYRCRLHRDRGTIFDTTFFATGIRHHIWPEGWEARISLDLAAAWLADGGRWDQFDWDNATWG